jgi:hypothetical protein
MQSMNGATHLEHRASSRLSKHEGESSFALCDRLDRTRANSQRQLPTDHDYAVPTREYQTDQSSLKSTQTAARSVIGKRKRKPPHNPTDLVDTVTPYQANTLIEHHAVRISNEKHSCILQSDCRSRNSDLRKLRDHCSVNPRVTDRTAGIPRSMLSAENETMAGIICKVHKKPHYQA